jgi:hypothetical protein
MGDVGCEIGLEGGLEGGNKAIVGGWWWLRTRIKYDTRSAATLARSARLMRVVINCPDSATRANPGQLPERDWARKSVAFSALSVTVSSILFYTRNNVHPDQLERFLSTAVLMIFRPHPERSRFSRQSYLVIDASRAIKLEQFTSGTEIKAMCRNTNQSTPISAFCSV